MTTKKPNYDKSSTHPRREPAPSKKYPSSDEILKHSNNTEYRNSLKFETHETTGDDLFKKK
ncbi:MULTISPECIES: hypothetical protein [Bacteria]|nr:hypothetical protein [Enterococcus faecalis]EGO2510022.1 hypothetical protein [Enterococcus faecalis]EGO2586811.1 hypothetical protein [Enterococcus faecalis]EGO2588140.1 hypothetical protein [Enterococcus faecalis]EGO5850445.1 hypothetical protein [Enterococcus faecalis]EGO5851898.1 hypothetical protein [Enterococcus faecalis]